MNKISLELEPVCIPYSNVYMGKLRLHVLQEKVYSLVSKGKNILLNAPTGSGKTLTLLSATDYGGAVGIYPNNTLLVNQRDSINDIITKHSGIGECIGYYDTVEKNFVEKCPDAALDSPLIIYKVRDDGILRDYEHIALLTISSKTIEKIEESSKREVIFSLAEKAYSYRNAYVVMLTTPDTFLLLYSGAYRDFSTVGKLVHNLLKLLAEGKDARAIENELRRTLTVTRASLAPIIGIRARLLEFPMFIDEFHLYGPYELDALYAILKLNKEVSIEELPVVFSSATPAEDTLEILKHELGLEYEKIEYNENSYKACSGGFQVRGSTVVDIVGVDTGYRGLGAYYHVGDKVSDIILSQYGNVLRSVLQDNTRALIILDRVYQVFQMVESLLRANIMPVECHVSISHPKCVDSANVVVGSQSITQGVNIDNVVFLATTAVSVEDAIQRIGRSGRRGLDSHVVLFAPSHRLDNVLDYGGKRLSYTDFIKEVLAKLYLDISNRMRDVTKNYDKLHRVRRKLIYSVAVTSLARVAGQHHILEKAREEIDKTTAQDVLENMVFGDSDVFALLLKFRRTGFKARYRIIGSDELREDDIGIVIRNARIVRVEGGILVIDPWNAPKVTKERDVAVLDASTIKDRLVRGRITRLNYLRKIFGAEVRVVNTEIKPLDDVLVYILRTPPASDYSLFLVQTGEALLVEFGSLQTIAVYF